MNAIEQATRIVQEEKPWQYIRGSQVIPVAEALLAAEEEKAKLQARYDAAVEEIQKVTHSVTCDGFAKGEYHNEFCKNPTKCWKSAALKRLEKLK